MSTVEPVMPLNVAVIVDEPTFPEDASPVLLTVATPVSEESHVTNAVRSCLALFE